MLKNKLRLLAVVLTAFMGVLVLAQYLIDPIHVSINPSQPLAGSTVTITVTLSSTPTSQQTVNLTASPSNAYSSLPSTMTFASGQKSASVNATLATGFTGNVTTTASNGAGSASIVTTTIPNR